VAVKALAAALLTNSKIRYIERALVSRLPKEEYGMITFARLSRLVKFLDRWKT
jgi:hypothetical protein